MREIALEQLDNLGGQENLVDVEQAAIMSGM